MGFFKDISETLAKKYPDKKVYVISDQHFDHKNIISMTRNKLFNSTDIDKSLKKMNDHIIKQHNKIVGKDDIVLMLGDFSFKTGQERLAELVSKLNGHKYLIMGNHDKKERPDIYLKAGFEDVFLSPIKFNGDFYSHYPLNASIESLDRPNSILYNLLCNEFSKSSFGINFHGHQHTYVNNGDREKNIACEEIEYKPLLVGRTKSYQSNNNPLYINEELENTLHKIISKYPHLQEKGIMTDYLYTILLELLSEYEDDIIVFGSVMLNKKYDSTFTPSDLDVTKLFNPNKSIAFNRNTMKEMGNNIYKRIIQINGLNSDFYKKIDFICILSFIYATKNCNYKGYLDMNVLLDEFYKSEDFRKITGESLLEKYAYNADIDISKTIKYPKFNVQTTNAMADITNCFLQYIYSNNKEAKRISLAKMKTIAENINYSGSKDEFETLQNMLIRYLLRNIYFFESARRKDDSNIILNTREIETPAIVGLNGALKNSLSTIINSNDYKRILKSISNANNRKKEVSEILKYYK